METVATDPRVFTPNDRTTGQCIAMLKRYVAPGCTVLDVGTGTGVLALEAIKLGAGYVLASDNERHAVEIATKNCKGFNIKVEQHEINYGINGTFDVIVSNLYINPQMEFVQYAEKNMNENSVLILTWIDGVSLDPITKRFDILERTQCENIIAFALKKRI